MPIPANEQIGTLFGAAVQKVGVLPTTAGTDNLFTVAGGNVQLVSILGELTSDDVTSSAASIDIKLTLDPTAAGYAATDMCDTLDIKAHTIGELYTVTGAVGVAMVGVATGLAVPSFGTNPQVLLPGVIILNMAEGVGGANDTTGEVTWTIVYYPLDLGAYIEAAA